MLRYHGLPSLSVIPIEDTEHLSHFWIGVSTYAVVVDEEYDFDVMHPTADEIGNLSEVSCASVEGAHDVQIPIMPVVTAVRIEIQVDLPMLGKTELLGVAIPVWRMRTKSSLTWP